FSGDKSHRIKSFYENRVLTTSFSVSALILLRMLSRIILVCKQFSFRWNFFIISGTETTKAPLTTTEQ
ncbi:MAG: hypothetical protein K2W88_05105, partial [Pararheinheimera sp.]|nr:hypothetical protein [Rheinheimera sp.]